MMYCEHGLIQENCPHCTLKMGIKPPTQLVTPASRELPIPRPYSQALDTKSNPTKDLLYSTTTSFPNPSVGLTREFDLTKRLMPEDTSLFAQKRGQLQKKHISEPEITNNLGEVSITDLRKKFDH